MQAALEHPSDNSADSDISSAVAHSVRAPLAALRASMEALAHGFQSEDPRSVAVHGALEEVVRLGQEMQTLLDFALPLPPLPLSCSLREIVCSAVDGLPPRRRASIWVAVEDHRTRLFVDGPLLSRSLTRLVVSPAADKDDSVLLRARTDGSDVVFAVVQGGPCQARPEDASPTVRTTSATSVLGVVLARRDVERMGGRFSSRRGEDGRTVSEIRFPASPTSQGTG